MMPEKRRFWFAVLVIAPVAMACGAAYGQAEQWEREHETHIRAGHGQTIVSVTGHAIRHEGGVARARQAYPHPQPRMVGFSPLVAITTSDQGFPLGHDLEFEHVLESSYRGTPLNPTADPHFVVGFLDSGSDVDLAAGSAAITLGLYGSHLTPNSIPIEGVGGQVFAPITMPVGFFAAGLSAVDSFGTLDYSALVGHSNVCGLTLPAISCGGPEVVTAIVGLPFLSFYNTVIRVDTPRTVTVGGVTYMGPDLEILDPLESLPAFPRAITMEFASALSPLVTTANYYPDLEDLETPIIPTLLSLGPGYLPSGGAFFADILVLEGEPGPTNPAQPMRVLVDTGAQSSIMSRFMAASLNLPFQSDFTIDVCGVGGLVEGVPGYFVDYVKINALGGAMEFSKAPFVVLDLPSPEGGTLDGILGMNFFWNRNVVFEPLVAASAGFFHVSDPVSVPYGDMDVSFSVSDNDVSLFISCVSGPGVELVDPVCDFLDADGDADVDLYEFRRMQLCYSGDATADPACGE